MAEFSKYSVYSIGRLFLHNNRCAGDGVTHSNESIKPERTFCNYHLKKGTPADVQNRLSEVFKVKSNSGDATVLGEMIVTLPQDTDPKDERDFFRAVLDFYSKDFGDENIMNAVIHKDEKTPHIHIDFVPVLKGTPEYTSNRGKKAIEDWKQTHNGEPPTERLCCKSLITRDYLRKMHPRLSAYVKESLGYEVGILNGATANGNKTVLQLKVETLKNEVEELEKQKSHLANDLKSVYALAEQTGINTSEVGLYPLMQKLEDLSNQNNVLKGIITRQGYSWRSDDLEAIRAKRYVPAQSTPVNIYAGSLSDASIESNAVVVVEIPEDPQRALPQQKLIDADADLMRLTRFVTANTVQPVVRRESRVDDKSYIFVRTGDTNQTMQNLLELERMLREMDLSKRKVYMDRISADEYDLARSILEKDKIPCQYYTSQGSLDAKAKELDLGLTQEKL